MVKLFHYNVGVMKQKQENTPPTYVLSPHAARQLPPAARLPVSEQPTEIWVGVPQPPVAVRRPWKWILLGGLLLGMVAILLLLAGGGALFYYSKVIVPGTTSMGVRLGGQTVSGATTTLQTAWEQRMITLAAGGQTWEVTPVELGMTLDAQATADSAYQQGRSLPSLLNGIQAGGFTVPPVWMFDPALAQTRLQQLAPTLQVVAVNAGLQLVNGRIEPTPAIPGQQLDVSATLVYLQQQAAEVMGNGRLDLVTTPVQPEISDMSAAAAQANQLLATPLVVRAYDPILDETSSWEIAPQEWVSWLKLTIDPATNQLTLTTHEAQIAGYLENWATQAGNGRYFKQAEAVTAVSQAIDQKTFRASLRVYYQDTTHIVQAGETLSSIGRDYGIPYPWIQQANPGIEALSVGQPITIPSPDTMLPLPVVENKRIVVSISEQHVWVYENGSLKWDWVGSTGIDSSPTSPGVFQIRSHEENAYAGNWDLWMPWFLGIYQPVPTSEFMNGFHGFPTRSGSQLLWTGDLGHKVTYGCILVSSENAEQLYEWAEEGVVVEVRP